MGDRSNTLRAFHHVNGVQQLACLRQPGRVQHQVNSSFVTDGARSSLVVGTPLPRHARQQHWVVDVAVVDDLLELDPSLVNYLGRGFRCKYHATSGVVARNGGRITQQDDTVGAGDPLQVLRVADHLVSPHTGLVRSFNRVMAGVVENEAQGEGERELRTTSKNNKSKTPILTEHSGSVFSL